MRKMNRNIFENMISCNIKRKLDKLMGETTKQRKNTA